LHIRYTCTAEIKFTTLLGVRFNTWGPKRSIFKQGDYFH
jgi:hypothetical protein